MVKKSKKLKSKINTTFADSKFFFDDCVICRGMKKAEETGKDLDMDDLKKLFKKANNNQK